VGWEEEDDRFITLRELVRYTLYDKVNSLFLWADVHEVPLVDRSGSVLLSCIKLKYCGQAEYVYLSNILFINFFEFRDIWYWRFYKNRNSKHKRSPSACSDKYLILIFGSTQCFSLHKKIKAQASFGIGTRDHSNRTFKDHPIYNVKTNICSGSMRIAEIERCHV
jgi:hypothetical protein